MERLIEPVFDTVETFEGTFTFTKDGKADSAEFYVRCEPWPKLGNPARDEIMDRRMDALNRQYIDAFKRLECMDCQNIKFTATKQNQFI